MCFVGDDLYVILAGKLAQFVDIFREVILLYSYYVDCLEFVNYFIVFQFIVLALLQFTQLSHYQIQHLIFICIFNIQQQTRH